jgi:5S rRNA maturation endonuclease (ribonuclease M5)
MGYHSVNDTTVERLREFINMLNEESENGSVIVVEGKRDVQALYRAGFNGNLTVFNHFKGVTHFVDNHYQTRNKIILLLDMDRTGKYLTSRLLRQLQYKGNNVSLSYKKALAKISNGKIRHVEDLVMYIPHLAGIQHTRRDLYFYV